MGVEGEVRFASVCSGIGAPECAWDTWDCQFAAEIERFPSAVHAARFPHVPNYGNLLKFNEWPHHEIDLLVAGCPCQSFSIAGLRKGLADPRGNLTLSFLAVIERYRPAWMVYENVPGLLSDKTGAFSAFLGGLGQLGYGFAYRILDAQYFGVVQRRRRVFVIGHSGGQWQRAAAVLFERESLCGDNPPGRETGERVAGTVGARTKGGGGLGTDFECDGGLIASTLQKHHGNPQLDQTMVAHTLGTRNIDGRNERGDNSGNLIAAPLMSGSSHKAGHNARSGHGKDATLIPAYCADIAPSRTARDVKGERQDVQNPSLVAFAQNADGDLREEVIASTINQNGHASGRNAPMLRSGVSVRRLTPTECERLQGFPDAWTAITYRNKPAADGPRYRALGNSMAVPVMRWIGQRIEQVHALTRQNLPSIAS